MACRAVDHLKKFPPATLDGASLNALRQILADVVAADRKVDETIPSHFRAEWDKIMGQDIREARDALAAVDAELTTRRAAMLMVRPDPRDQTVVVVAGGRRFGKLAAMGAGRR